MSTTHKPTRREAVQAALLPACGRPLPAAGRPNILLIMCDQLTASVLSCYGGPVQTPNIDRLAREGVVFTEATCTTPFCSPTRASIVTGLYPHTHGIVYNVNRVDYPAIRAPRTEEGLKASDVTTEKLLSAAGYSTHHYGKWHLGDEELPYYREMYQEHHEYAREMETLFREVRAKPRAQWMDWYGWALPVTVAPQLRKAAEALGGAWDKAPYAEFVRKAGRLEFPANRVFDYRVADKTVERIRRSSGRPFMITCSFNYPHDPNVVPSPYYDSIDPGRIALPANFGQPHSRFENDWSRRIVRDLGEAATRELLRIYYASVKLVDDQVGRVLQALEESGAGQDTVVLFTSDHGDMAGGHGMFWKSTSAFYDEIVRVPLIIRYLRRIKPGRSAVPTSHVDILPTLLEFCGLPVPKHVQGRSLGPLLLGRRSEAARPAYSFAERVAANPEHSRRIAEGTRASLMVRNREWKYFRYPDGEEFLFNLVKDPGETSNLAGDSNHGRQKELLRRELADWLLRTAYPGGKASGAGV